MRIASRESLREASIKMTMSKQRGIMRTANAVEDCESTKCKNAKWHRVWF